MIYIVLDFKFAYTSSKEGNHAETYVENFRFLRILILLRAIKILEKLDYMTFIFQVLKNSMLSFISIFGLFFLFICFSALLGRSLYKEIDSRIFPDDQHFSTFSQSFMTIFTIITLDNWSDLFNLGRDEIGKLISISTFLILIICIGIIFLHFINF